MILNLTPANAFITLSNILNRPVPISFLTGNTESISKTYSLVLKTLAYKLPALHAHLILPTTKINPAEYMNPMFQSLFCSQKYGMDIASRIFDVYVFEGDAALIRASVGTFAKLESRLYGSHDEILELLGSSKGGPWDMGKEDEFMAVMREMGKVEEGDDGKAPNIVA